MAIKFVDEADLTTVCNAIRAKTGGSDLLTFPAGMAAAIATIEAGGGGGSVLQTSDGRAMTVGSFTPAENVTFVQVTHDLGALPYGCFFWTNDDPFAQTDVVEMITGHAMFSGYKDAGDNTGDKPYYGFSGMRTKYSAAAMDSDRRNLGYISPSAITNAPGSPLYNYITSSFTNTVIYAATDSTVKIGNKNNYFYAGHTYHYILFGRQSNAV